MMNLSEGMGTHRSDTKLGRPTLHQTEGNRYPLNCGICRELFFVDEHILRRVYLALERDQSGMTFSCEACEEQYAEQLARFYERIEA
jgi:hypothetical protein